MTKIKTDSKLKSEMNIGELYNIYKECGGRVTTDSRKVEGGELFFALKGGNFDGNEYAMKALEAGAAYAVVDRSSAVATEYASSGASAWRLPEPVANDTKAGRTAVPENITGRLIPVDDTLAALQALARWHRSMTFVDGRPLTVLALTGTNGKTTTKELIRAVLATEYTVTATEGNLNNSIGVPLTLLKINADTRIAVVEMGASHPGDIRELTSVALPTYGLITNVGKAHLLGFGSLEGVMAAKGELYDYLQRTADKAFVNADNPYLREMAAARPDLKTIPYGLRYEGAEVLPSSPEHPYLRIRLADGTEVGTHLVGAYNADNVMTALAVGREFGIPEEDAVKAISDYVPTNNRSQMVRTGSKTLIVDAYNANPASMEAAIDNLASVDAGHKAVMLGNMLELGADSVREHVSVLKRLGTMKCLDRILLVGEEFRKALDAMRLSCNDSCGSGMATSCLDGQVKWFATSSGAADWLKENPLSGYCVLVKGSRGTKMEEVLPCL